MAGIDIVVVSILAIAAARGLSLGLVREAFSLAGLGAAVFAVWQFGDAATAALAPHVGDALPAAAVHALAVAALGIGTVLATAIVGRLVRRSVQFVGLGLLDRLAGGCLGVLEGGLVAALLLAGLTFVLEPSHPWLAGSQAVAAFDRARAQLGSAPVPAHDVAAPGARPSR